MRLRALVAGFLMAAAPAQAQTSADLAPKYPAVSAYQVRPDVLMTAKYAEDGQVCEMILEKRHYDAPQRIDLGSAMPAALVGQLIDELAPAAQRGDPTSRWLTNSYVAGGVTYSERDYENLVIAQYGSYSCKASGQPCDGGDEIIVIRWKKRECAGPKVKGAAGSAKPSDNHANVGTTKNPPPVPPTVAPPSRP